MDKRIAQLSLVKDLRSGGVGPQRTTVWRLLEYPLRCVHDRWLERRPVPAHEVGDLTVRLLSESYQGPGIEAFLELMKDEDFFHLVAYQVDREAYRRFIEGEHRKLAS